MCTITVLHRVSAQHPLVIAANRDELYAREATGPTVLSERPRVVGGRDLTGGGTWFGVTETGLFMGLTNQRTWFPPDPALHSRGQVVIDALRAGSVSGARNYLEQLDPRRFNPFNVIYGTTGAVEVAYVRPDPAEVEIVALAPGLHVLANDRIGSTDFPKTRRARDLLSGVDAVDGWEALLSRLRAVLCDHERPPAGALPTPPSGSWIEAGMLRELQALCIHTPSYGTCSSSIVEIGEEGPRRYLFAPGAPCTSTLADVGHLLRPRRVHPDS